MEGAPMSNIEKMEKIKNEIIQIKERIKGIDNQTEELQKEKDTLNKEVEEKVEEAISLLGQ
jgi:predicted  nucleic acid-binding Zn-ribbon protein